MPAILLIDHKNIIGDLLRAALASQGCRILTANAQGDAIRLLQQHRPQVILVSLDVEGVDPVELISEIRKFDPAVSIVAVTGFETEAQEARLRSVGIQDFVPKTFPLKVLSEAARRLLGEQRQPELSASVVSSHEAEKESGKSHGPWSKGCLVIIDDDPLICRIVSEVLIFEGFEVHCAQNGDRGLALIKELNPALILLDISMPQMNGIDVLQHLRRNDYHGGVIVMTGCNEAKMVEAALKLDVLDILLKPFECEEIVEKVRVSLDVLDTKGSNGEDQDLTNR